MSETDPLRKRLAAEQARCVELEKRLRAVETELERCIHERRQAEVAKSTFLANISHELRTPLHGILSFSRFGHRNHRDAEREKLGKFFTTIESCGTGLLKLLDDLLELARLESDWTVFRFAPTDLVLVVREAIDELGALATERALTVELSGSLDVWPSLDAGGIGRVVRELVGNAVKHSPAGGTIRVRIGECGPRATFSVEDEGGGVPEEELEQIFGKFVQSTRDDHGAGGRGLGLAICAEIVRAHAGEIRALNHSGGARFEVSLPVSRDAAVPSDLPAL